MNKLEKLIQDKEAAVVTDLNRVKKSQVKLKINKKQNGINKYLSKV